MPKRGCHKQESRKDELAASRQPFAQRDRLGKYLLSAVALAAISVSVPMMRSLTVSSSDDLATETNLAAFENSSRFHRASQSSDKILSIENNKPIHLPKSDPANLLIAALRRQGAKFKGRPHTFADGLRGVIATAPTPAASKVMELPLDCVLYEATVAPDVWKACRDLPCEDPESVVVLGLAYERERGAASRFAHYIKTLPLDTSEITNSVTWPTPLLRLSEIAQLGKPLHTGRLKQELLSASKLLRFPVQDEDQLLWALAIVKSRGFHLSETGVGLLPGADLFNHHWDPENVVEGRCDMDDRKCYLFAQQDLKVGEQIFVTYGPMSNLELLFRHGFSMSDNPWGPVVPFPHLNKFPLWLSAAGCEGEVLKLRAPPIPGLIPLSKSALRCSMAAFVENSQRMQSEKVQDLWRKGAFDGEPTTPASWHIVDRAARAIAGACRKFAKRWHTTDAKKVLAEVAAVGSDLAGSLLKAVQHELSLLQLCRDSMIEYVSKAQAAARVPE